MPNLIKSVEAPKAVRSIAVQVFQVDLSLTFSCQISIFCLGIVNVKSRESLVMSAVEGASAAEDPFGAAPFRLPQGNCYLNTLGTV